MTRQLEQEWEDRKRREVNELAMLVDGGLEAAVAHAGGVLTGFSIRLNSGDCLMTMRVVLAGRRQIAFVGSDTLGNVLRKATREARKDGLTFRDDKYGT